MTTPVAGPASYPGTVKVYSDKLDGQVIYGAHAMEWQREIDAIESIVGTNPQGTYLTVKDRISFLEGDTVRLEGNQNIAGTKDFTGTLQTDGYLIANNAPVTFKYAGRTFSWNNAGLQQFDGAGTVAKDMVLQPSGGQVYRGGYKMWDSGNDGPGSGLDADTLDGHQSSDFLIKQGCQVGMTTDQSVPPCPLNGDVFTHRYPLNLNVVQWEHTPGDGTTLWHPSGTYGPYFLIPTSGLWLIDVNVAWTGPWQGARAFGVRNGDYPANSLSSAATTYMGGSVQLGVGPPVWPDPNTYDHSGTFSTTTIFPSLIDKTRIMYLAAGTKLRVDVFNWNDAGLNSVVHHDNNTHMHQPTNAVIAQVV
jgi:hypothetical protein